MRSFSERPYARLAATAGTAAFIATAAVGILLAGCAVGPDFVRPAAPALTRYTHGMPPTVTLAADGVAQHFVPEAPVAADWWRLFNSSQLDGVVREAIANEPGLQAAQAALRESQDNLRAGYGVFYPQLDIGAGAARQLYSPLKVGQAAAGSIFSLFTLSATVSYAIDVFGGARRGLEGLQAQTDLQRQTVAATYLALSGNIVNTLIARAGYLAQIKSTEQLAALLREQVRITEAQVAAGTVPYSALLGIRSQLAATAAALPPLRQKLDQTAHLLATLTGRAPAEWSPPLLELADFTLPEALPLTLPSGLVRRRPDILAAEAALHVASANVGVATAALFPSVALSASYGTNANTFATLGASSGKFWSTGVNAAAPIFDGGTLRFKRKAAVDAYQQAEADYRRAVLAAFAQVADTLRGLEHDAETLHAQSEQLATAREALRLIEINYRTGTVNYLAVLNADTQYQQARIGYLQTTAQRLQDSVALFVALGGGWWNADARVFGERALPGSGAAGNAASGTAVGDRP